MVEHRPAATSAESHHDQGSLSATGQWYTRPARGGWYSCSGCCSRIALVADALGPALGRWSYVAVAMAGLFGATMLTILNPLRLLRFTGRGESSRL